MAIASTTGAKIYIGPVTPAATLSAYAALSYTEIKNVESISEFGDQSAAVNFTSLSDNRVRKRKGVRDAGDITVVCGHDPLDAGQLAALAAGEAEVAYAFKVVLADGADANDTDSTFYFHALVMNTRLNIGAANEIIKRNFMLAIDTAIFDDLSEAVS
jgi:hypothetical protein